MRSTLLLHCLLVSIRILCEGVKLEFTSAPRRGCGRVTCYSELFRVEKSFRHIYDMRLSIFYRANTKVDLYYSTVETNMSWIPGSEINCHAGVFGCQVRFENIHGNILVVSTLGSPQFGPDKPSSIAVSGLVRNSMIDSDVLMKKLQDSEATENLDIERRIVRDFMRVIKPNICMRGMPAFNSRVIVALREMSDEDFLCDTETDGGGWIIFQRRTDGLEDFDRDWREYRYGFGSISGDFWRGNEALYLLTNMGRYEMRVDITFGETRYFAHYALFNVSGPADRYRLHIGRPVGGDRDFFGMNNRTPAYNLDHMPFSARDVDYDTHPDSCAAKSNGGFWYNGCSVFRPNGKFGEPDRVLDTGDMETMYFVEMKIRLLPPVYS